MITHEQAEERVKMGFIIHLVIYLVVVGGLMALNITRRPEHLWSIWVACGWGLGVILHAVGVFVDSKSRERMIERVMARVDRRSEHRHPRQLNH